MKHFYTTIGISLGLLFLVGYPVFGQNICTQELRRARTLYDDGKIHELPNALESCLKSGFSSEEKVEAYRLLTLAYIYLDEGEKADESMLALLHENPEYQPNEALDPSEYIQLYKTFRTWPIYRLGGKVGPNYTGANVWGLASSHSNTNSNPSYTPKLGFHVGFNFELPINKRLSLLSGISFANHRFQYEVEKLFVDENGEEISTNNFLESQSWITVPVWVQYEIFRTSAKDRWLIPYTILGATGGYIMGGTVSSVRFVNGGQDVREKPIRLNSYTTFNAFATAGMGGKVKVKGGYFVMEVLFNYGLTRTRNLDVILENENEYIFDYMGVYDDISLNNVQLNLGYMLNVYKPKKIVKR
jgi:hypothetical protein